MGIPLLVICCFSLVAYSIFFFAFNFCKFRLKCVSASSPLGISCMHVLDLSISFPMLGKLSAVITLNMFQAYSLPFPSGTSIIHILH